MCDIEFDATLSNFTPYSAAPFFQNGDDARNVTTSHENVSEYQDNSLDSSVFLWRI